MPVIPIPKRDGVDIVIGRTPLDLSDFADAHEGGFAVYAHGLTIEEAGELTRLLWADDWPAKDAPACGRMKEAPRMFTPGPWTIERGEPSGQGEWHYWLINGEHGTITGIGAASQRGPIDMESNRGNALLIAAAPDLYAALDDIMRSHGPGTLQDEQFAAAVEALEKARGEKQG